jgi:uridine kinase
VADAKDRAELAELIAGDRRALRDGRALLVAISGIDAAGKGTLARELAADLRDRGMAVATIGIDPWQTDPALRPPAPDAAAHFYRHGFRFEALFGKLVDPLTRDRAIDLRIELMDPHRNLKLDEEFHFRAVDVVLLEGIFLFKRRLRHRYDRTIWVECGFETALARALRRNQEGLAPDRLVDDYRRIYFPAQKIHFSADEPREFADLTLRND